MKTKILILGSGGMAGHVISQHFRQVPDQYEVIDVTRSNNSINPSVLLDVTDFQKLELLITTQKADVIINCVGLLNQNAEDHPDQAVLLNSYLPHFLERITKDSSSQVIHISTDCVFSGGKGNYTEKDFKDGHGFYAQSKALGEILNNKDITLRTSIIGPELNAKGIGLFHWFSRQRGEIKGYTQAMWSGITTIELAKSIEKAIGQNITGLYHLTNNDVISKYGLLTLFKEEFLNSRVSTIISTTDYKVDKSLTNTRNDFNFSIPSYKEMIKEMKIWIEINKELYPHYKEIIE